MSIKKLYIDIESSPNLEESWSIFQKQRHYNAIVKERAMLCVAWSWAGSDEIEYCSIMDDPKRFKEDPWDDRVVIEQLHPVVSSADIIVGHNIDRFDLPRIRTSAIVNNLHPFPKPLTFDTYKISKNLFDFNCDRLDYLAKRLKVSSGKLPTSQASWHNVLFGPYRERRAALERMIEYNVNDVDPLLTGVEEKLSPWVNSHPTLNLVDDANYRTSTCGHCLSEGTLKHSPSWTNYMTTGFYYKRYRCKSCKGWSRGRFNIGRRS